jgi:heme exporter protein D
VSAFFHMGGHAAFVWPAYVVAAVVLVAMLVLSLRRLRHEQNALEARSGRRP